MSQIKIVAFDADDTLWVNETYFRETEERFCDLLEGYMDRHSVMKTLYQMEIQNLKHYGYGVKGFTLSMIETIGQVSGNRAPLDLVNKALMLGREMLYRPIELLDGVEEVLSALQGNYRLVMATKGDLLDQERKLVRSGLEKYFHHIEVMSNKEEADYAKLIRHLDAKPSEFLMVGNSVKSDILPVLALGGHAIHVPFHTTWEHEQVDLGLDGPHFLEASNIREVLNYLGR